MEHTRVTVSEEPDLLGNQAKALGLPLGMAPQQGSTFAPATMPPSSPIGIHVGRPVAILPHIDPSLPIGLAAAGLGLTKNTISGNLPTAGSAVPYAISPYSLDLSGAAEQSLYGTYRPEKGAMAPEPSASGEMPHRNPNHSRNGSLNLSMGPLQQPQATATTASPEQLATLLHHYQYLQLQLIHYQQQQQQQQQQEQQQRQAGFPQSPPGGRLGQHASFGNGDGNGHSHSMGGDGERNCSNSSTSSSGIASHTGDRRDGARDAAAATAPPPGGLTSLLSTNSAPSALGMQEATAALAAHLNGGSSSAGGVEGGRRQGKSVGEDAEGEAAAASECNGHHHDHHHHHHHHHHQHQLQQQQQKHGQDPGATLGEQADEAEEEEEEEGTGQRAEGGGGLLGGREDSPNGECTSQTSSEGMREIEELLKRLNPLAKEFVPPPSPLSTPSSVASPHSLSSAQTQVMSPFFPYAPAPLLGPLPPLGQLAAALGQVAAMSQAGQVPASPGAAGMMWPDHHRFNYRQQQQQHGRYQQRQQQQHHHGHHHPQQQQQRQPHRGGQGAVLRAGSAPHSDFSQGGRFANGAGAGERAVGKWDRRPGGGEDGRRGARGVGGAPAPAAAGAGEGIGGGNGAAEGPGAAETAAGAGLGFADAAVAATSAASVASKGAPKNGRSKTAEQSVRRTVYVSDLDQQVTEEQLAEIFQTCGQVVDCRICGDPTSVLRFAFVEFTEEEAAKKALGLAGTMLGFYPLRVLPSKTAIQPVNPRYLPRSEEERELCARTVYCTNIDRKVTQVDVKLFFETLCGEVSKLRLLGDFQHHTRIAFVEFAQAESATAALNCSGAVLGSLPIRVSPSKTPVRPRAAKPDGTR